MIRWYFLASILPLLSGCATPVPPSGGPIDTTPPELVGMYPPSNSVDFRGDVIRFDFSERVDRASFEQALGIVPELAQTPELHWKGRSLEMRFVDPLSEATTYVFTFDNALRDEHGVKLRQPIVRAVATGSVIDEGVLSGRVLDAGTGRPVPNIDVVAVRIDTLEEKEAASTKYRTQTGPDGSFELSFLPPSPFFVLGFEDLNRSGAREAGERFAVPPRKALLPFANDSTRGPLNWFAVDPDTTSPTITYVRPRSSRRIEIRYSEIIRIDSLVPEAWSIIDTVSGQAWVPIGTYLAAGDRRRLVLLTDSLPPSFYRIGGRATVRDSTGNIAQSDAPTFQVTPARDTLRQRLLGFTPASPGDARPILLTMRQRPGLRFNQFVRPEILREMVQVTDTTGKPRVFDVASQDGATWYLDIKPPLRQREIVHVQVAARLAGADTLAAMDFRRLGPGETGSLTGFVESSGEVVVEVYAEQAKNLRLESRIRTDGAYEAAGLPVGSYRLRIFSDRNADGEWDWGQVEPYRVPEPMLWYPDSARVRRGWETVLDTVRLGGLASIGSALQP